jgi:hypothetical protein
MNAPFSNTSSQGSLRGKWGTREEISLPEARPIHTACLLLIFLMTLVACPPPLHEGAVPHGTQVRDPRPHIPPEIAEPVMEDLRWMSESECEKPGDRKKRPALRPPAKPFRGHKRDAHFNTMSRQAAKRYEVNPALVKAIIMAESGYDPKAVSKRGAMGLMQLMPATAEALGVEDSFDPAHNINAGVRYFRQLLNRFDGDVRLALAAYNAGSKKVREYQGIPPFKSTRYYIEKVFEYYRYYKRELGGGPDRV